MQQPYRESWMKSRGKNSERGSPVVQRPNPTARVANAMTWIAALASVCLASGCELGDSVQQLAEDLGNPDPQNVESPGHLVAPGQFRGLSFDGNAVDGPYVVSVRDGVELSIVSFPEGKECSAGPVNGFGTSVAHDDTPFDARIPMVATATETTPATLRFVDFKCRAAKLKIPGADLPLAQTFTKKPGFIVQKAAEGELLFVNPWSGKQERIATGATPIRNRDLALFAEGEGGQVWMWTLESGQLVARNSDLKEVFRAGKNLTSAVHIAKTSLGAILALQDDSRSLFTVQASDPSSLRLISQDACGEQFNVGNYGPELLYYAPCQEHSLHLIELETDVVRDVRAGILDYKVVEASETGPVLLYITAPESEGGDTGFWARWGQNDPIRLGDNGHLGLSRVNSKGEARVVVDWDGAGGTLLVGALGEPLKERAKSVAYHSSAGIISNFDGENGTLQRFTPEDKLEVIAQKVSPRGIRNDNMRERALFLTDFNGTDGRLVLIEGDSIRSMSTKVRPNSYQFTVQEDRVTLLSDLDTETNTATLQLPSTEYDDDTVINTGVAESLEVDWPSRGLLYSAPAADEPGIYFARFY